MATYYGNLLTNSGGNQGRLECDIWDSGPSYDGWIDVWIVYRFWSRYSVTDSSNVFSWNDARGNGSGAVGISHGGSGGNTTLRSESFRTQVGYDGGATRVIGSLSGINAFGGTTQFDVTHGLSARIRQAPTPPRNLRLVAVSSDRVDLQWDGSENNNGSGIEGYLLRRWDGSQASGNYQDVSFENNNVRHQAGLAPGSTHTFAVYAKNAIGYSGVSNTLTVRVNPVTPSAPRDVRASNITNTSVVISWDPSLSNGGAGIDGYLLRMWLGAHPSPNPAQDVSFQNNTARTVSGLTAGQTYTFAAYARNEAGYSVISNIISVKIPPYLPAAPASLTPSMLGPTSVRLTIGATPNDGGEAPSGYLLRRWPGLNGDTVNPLVISENLTMVRDVTGLLPGTQYTFEAFARNSSGYSAPRQVAVLTLSGVRVWHGGSWKIVVPYVKVNGEWVQATVYVKHAGVWKLSQ